MTGDNVIDTTYDVRRDAGGNDPDSHSATLHRYHQLLWSKPLPDGTVFELESAWPDPYLHHRSARGEFWLASDSVMQTFIRWVRMRPIISQFTEVENDEFFALGYTIGGMMVYPGNKVDGKMTINGARGFNRKIADRIDLTQECIRRHYQGEDSPLTDTMARYADFFELFGDFRGYTEFFLLQDLVSVDYDTVEFFAPFDDFERSGVPSDLDTYKAFRQRSIAFIQARNRRIDERVAALERAGYDPDSLV